LYALFTLKVREMEFLGGPRCSEELRKMKALLALKRFPWWTIALVLETFLKVFAPYSDVTSQHDARNLPTVYTSVNPTLAHCQYATIAVLTVLAYFLIQQVADNIPSPPPPGPHPTGARRDYPKSLL